MYSFVNFTYTIDVIYIRSTTKQERNKMNKTEIIKELTELSLAINSKPAISFWNCLPEDDLIGELDQARENYMMWQEEGENY